SRPAALIYSSQDALGYTGLHGEEASSGTMAMQSRTTATDGAPAGALLLSPWAGLILAWIAGGITWGLIQATHPVFHVPEQYHAAMGAGEAAFAANRRAQDQVERGHAMLYVGSLGFLIGGVLAAREA